MECQTPGCFVELKKCFSDGFKKKLSTMALVYALGSIIAVGGTISILTYNAYSGAQTDKQVSINLNRNEAILNKLSIVAVQGDIKNIQEDIADSKVIQKNIFDKLDKINEKIGR